MSTICVFGGNGLLGSSLVPFLRNIGYSVVCLTRSEASQGEVRVNYNDQTSVNQALDSIRPLYIINLAAVTDVDRCELYPNVAYQGNVLVVERICFWLSSQRRPPHLIHISTDHLYDSVGDDNEENIKIVNYYGFSKYAGELVAQGVDATILRTNFFGKSKCIGRGSFSDWAYAALKDKRKINIFDDIFFNPLHINTVVKVITIILLNPIRGTFNLGSKFGFSKAQFIFNFASVLNLNTKYATVTQAKNIESRTQRPKDMRMDCMKIEAATTQIVLPKLDDEIKKLKDEYTKF